MFGAHGWHRFPNWHTGSELGSREWRTPSKALLQANSGTAPEARVSAHPFFGPQETDPRKPQRVCQKCFDLLLPMQARHDGAILRAILRAIL